MMREVEALSEFRRVLNESALLLRQNRPGEALTLLQPLLEAAPTQPDIAINVGGAYIMQHKWNRAVTVLSKAVEANPDNVMLWTNLAAAHLGNLETAGPKHQARAIAAYERALALDPQAPNLHYHLGLIYKEQGNLTTASQFFRRALEVNPADRDARYWLEQLSAHNEIGETFRQQGDSPYVMPDDQPDNEEKR